jgi:hypothetical protein
MVVKRIYTLYSNNKENVEKALEQGVWQMPSKEAHIKKGTIIQWRIKDEPYIEFFGEVTEGTHEELPLVWPNGINSYTSTIRFREVGLCLNR